MACPYKHALGFPGEGVHAARFMGISLNDTLMTIAAAFLTAFFTGGDIVVHLFFWFVGGEILHYLFGTQTAFLTMIGVRACPGS